MRPTRLCAFLLAMWSCACLATLAGCARTTTAAEIEHNGTRAYPGEKRAHVVKAAAVALKSLGYEVVVADDASGRVKTAPKVVQVRAVGNATYATAYEDALAWNLDVDQEAAAAVVHAHPRASRNGQPLAETEITAAYMDKSFAQLFDEIDEELRGARDGAHDAPASGAKDAPKANRSAH